MLSTNDAKLESEYNNRAAVKDHADYFRSWAERSLRYRQQAGASLNVRYGESDRQLLDIFPAQVKTPAPVHVFIHGGYWQAMDKDFFSFMAQSFNQRGELAVIVNYDLCPQVSLGQIIGQIKSAVVWIQHHIHDYGGDKNRVQLSGHSAGGHLLGCCLTTEWSKYGLDLVPFKRVNALSGLYDLKPLVYTSINTALDLNETSASDISPMTQAVWPPAGDVKLNLLVGGLESDAYKNQSKDLSDAWNSSLHIDYVEIENTHHFSMLDRFLDDYYPRIAVWD